MQELFELLVGAGFQHRGIVGRWGEWARTSDDNPLA